MYCLHINFNNKLFTEGVFVLANNPTAKSGCGDGWGMMGRVRVLHDILPNQVFFFVGLAPLKKGVATHVGRGWFPKDLWRRQPHLRLLGDGDGAPGGAVRRLWRAFKGRCVQCATIVAQSLGRKGHVRGGWMKGDEQNVSPASSLYGDQQVQDDSYKVVLHNPTVERASWPLCPVMIGLQSSNYAHKKTSNVFRWLIMLMPDVAKMCLTLKNKCLISLSNVRIG